MFTGQKKYFSKTIQIIIIHRRMGKAFEVFEYIRQSIYVRSAKKLLSKNYTNYNNIQKDGEGS